MLRNCLTFPGHSRVCSAAMELSFSRRAFRQGDGKGVVGVAVNHSHRIRLSRHYVLAAMRQEQGVFCTLNDIEPAAQVGVRDLLREVEYEQVFAFALVRLGEGLVDCEVNSRCFHKSQHFIF